MRETCSFFDSMINTRETWMRAIRVKVDKKYWKYCGNITEMQNYYALCCFIEEINPILEDIQRKKKDREFERRVMVPYGSRYIDFPRDELMMVPIFQRAFRCLSEVSFRKFFYHAVKYSQVPNYHFILCRVAHERILAGDVKKSRLIIDKITDEVPECGCNRYFECFNHKIKGDKDWSIKFFSLMEDFPQQDYNKEKSATFWNNFVNIMRIHETSYPGEDSLVNRLRWVSEMSICCCKLSTKGCGEIGEYAKKYLKENRKEFMEVALSCKEKIKKREIFCSDVSIGLLEDILKMKL